MLESDRKALKNNRVRIGGDGEAFKGDENELNAGVEALKANGDSFKDNEKVLKCDAVRYHVPERHLRSMMMEKR